MFEEDQNISLARETVKKKKNSPRQRILRRINVRYSTSKIIILSPRNMICKFMKLSS